MPRVSSRCRMTVLTLPCSWSVVINSSPGFLRKLCIISCKPCVVLLVSSKPPVSTEKTLAARFRAEVIHSSSRKVVRVGLILRCCQPCDIASSTQPGFRPAEPAFKYVTPPSARGNSRSTIALCRSSRAFPMDLALECKSINEATPRFSTYSRRDISYIIALA